MAIRFKRKTPDTWEKEELLSQVGKIRISKVNGQVMFPSSHDITPENINLSLQVITQILKAGNKVLIVSKPHLSCISMICDEFKDFKQDILFRFSIGSSNNTILKFWELNAPTFEERIESLKFAFNHGFKTSISCEPMLDNKIEEVVEMTLPYVTDSIWIGKMNFLIRRLKINGFTDKRSVTKAKQLLDWQKDEYILNLFDRYKDNPLIKWKESIKKVLDIELPKTKGLDI